MRVTQSMLKNIVTQASYLTERLSNKFLDVDTIQINEQNLSNESLNRWCQVVAGGDWKKFQKRLLWDELEINTVSNLVKTPLFVENQILPDWAFILKEIVHTASEWEILPISHFAFPIDSENPLPFEDLLLPSVSVARQKLLTHLGTVWLSPHDVLLEILSEESYLKLERSLLSSLVNLCEKTLEF